ncbi:isochorismate synthase MenF [Microbacteriaceae bacterium 4G12]
MIRTEQQGLQQSLLTAIRQATIDKSSLVSIVKKVAWTDPLLFYAAGNRLGYTECFYWSDPEQRVVFAGIGSAFTIADSSQNRFQDARQAWNEILEKTVVNCPAYRFGTGPILFGGFSFDPLQQKTKLWNAFSDTVLMLPAFLLTIKEGEAWLTTNQFVTHSDCAEVIENEMKQKEQQLLELCKEPLEEQFVSIVHEHEVEPEKWMQSICDVQQSMKQGHVQKVVLARELKLTLEDALDSAHVIQSLRIGQPDCYIFSLNYGGSCFLGATPERLIRKENHIFTSMCLAGSIGRGSTPEEDEHNGEALLHDEKNLVEHQYVADMIRHVMKEHCQEVNVPLYPGLMKTKNLIHLYTPVQGKGNADLLTMVEQLHPTPALGGTPRMEALTLIRQSELLDRGLYAGPIGWMDYEGNGEFAVGIRSGLINGKDVSLFAGCGIVEDSVPQLEYEETKMKFKPMLSALGGNTK